MENEEKCGGRPHQPDDASRRQRTGVRHRVPARLGGGAVPEPAHHGRERRQRPRGGAAARLCRPHPRPPPRDREPRRQPPALRQLAEQHPEPLHRRTAGRPCRADRVGGAAARPHADRAERVLQRLRRAVPADGAPAEGGRGVGAAGPAAARRRDPGRRPRVPPEVRLRDGDRGTGGPARHRLRQGGRQARARPLRGKRRRSSGAARPGPAMRRHSRRCP